MLRLNQLGLINKKGKKIFIPSSFNEFNNYVPIKSLFELIIYNQNLFYFSTIFELLITITDYLQIIIELKKALSLDYFILIDFESFYLHKNLNNNFHTLVFQDKSIFEHFSQNEINLKEDSIRQIFIKGCDQNVQEFIYDKLKVSEATRTVKLNTAFYFNSHDIYFQLKQKFSFELLEKFYYWSIFSFIYNYLLKKLKVVNHVFKGPIYDTFNCLRVKIREVLLGNISVDKLNNKDRVSYISKELNGIDNKMLSNLKEKLCYLLFNSKEFIDFKRSFENIHSTRVNNQINEMYLDFCRSNVIISHGTCDLIQNVNHNGILNFIKIGEINQDKDKLSAKSMVIMSVNRGNNLCINCVKNFLYSSEILPENIDKKIRLKDFLVKFKLENKDFPIEFALRNLFTEVINQEDIFIFKKEMKIYLSKLKKMNINEHHYREIDEIVN